MIAWLAGAFGLLIGSFLNVCIYRWPRDLSVVKPRSRCSGCGQTIAWYDNVPVLSYLLLRGKCRRCGVRIPWRYPLVELMTAACFWWFARQYGLTLATLKYCVFSSIVIGLIFSDLEMLLLPDEFTVGGLVIGLGFALMSSSLLDSVVGAFIPAAVLWLVGWAFSKLRHKDALGFGDVKMIAMIGAFLGIRGSLATILLGSILGSVVGIVYLKAAGKDSGSTHLPFGSFLGAGALLAAGGLSDWYWRMLVSQ